MIWRFFVLVNGGVEMKHSLLRPMGQMIRTFTACRVIFVFVSLVLIAGCTAKTTMHVSYLDVPPDAEPPSSTVESAQAGSALVEKPAKKPSGHSITVRFSFTPDVPASSVCLAGEFNGWSDSQSRMMDSNDDGVYAIEMRLKPGTYQYKFVVDGRWYKDPDNPDTAPDGFGGQNSVIVVSGSNAAGATLGKTSSSKLDHSAGNGGGVPAFYVGQRPDMSYTVFGKAGVYREKSIRFAASTSENTLLEMLKAEVARRGADALVGVQTKRRITARLRGAGFDRWVSGLMVQYCDPRYATDEPLDFGVAILPLLDENQQPYKDSGYIMEIAQVFLENLGYYTMLCDDSAALTFSEISTMDSNAIASVGGTNMKLLFLASLERTAEDQKVVVKSAEAFLRLMLIDKQTREVLWESEGGGSASYGFLISPFFDEVKGALKPALVEGFTTMPTYRRCEFVTPGK